MNIGIAGYGTVGKAIAEGFKGKVDLHVYDPAYSSKDGNQFHDSAELLYRKSDLIFVCVPTPQKLEEGKLWRF